MLLSLATMLLCGLLLSSLFQKIKLPGLVGMLLTGIILGPYVLNVIHPSILDFSPDLRQLALIVILARAGLALDIKDLKKVGRPALLMCFVPALFEILGFAIIAPKLMGVTIAEALLMGSVLAAVSPAVIVPKMIKLMDEGYGKKKSIPQMILAAASVDDIFVIVLFTSFLGLTNGEGFSAISLINIPISIVLGVLLGVVVGLLLGLIFKKAHMRDTAKVIIILSVSLMMVSFENVIKDICPVSGLLAVMSMGISLKGICFEASNRLCEKFSKIWVVAEIILFVLVGAAVDISYALSSGGIAILMIIFALLFRMLGVLICLIKTNLKLKERLFCMIAYLPKATVQAAIGAIPLSMGLACGKTILTVAVMSILITAPIGAFLIDLLYRKCLERETNQKYIKTSQE